MTKNHALFVGKHYWMSWSSNSYLLPPAVIYYLDHEKDVLLFPPQQLGHNLGLTWHQALRKSSGKVCFKVINMQTTMQTRWILETRFSFEGQCWGGHGRPPRLLSISFCSAVGFCFCFFVFCSICYALINKDIYEFLGGDLEFSVSTVCRR